MNKLIVVFGLLLLIPILGFKKSGNCFSISCFEFSKGRVEICFHNRSLTDTVVVPNFYLRQGKVKNRVILRDEFYSVSGDTLYLKLSSKPSLAGVSTSHKIEGLYIDGVYNDYKLAPQATKSLMFEIASEHKNKTIRLVNVSFDDCRTVSALKRNE